MADLSAAGIFLVISAMGLLTGVVVILVLKWLGIFDFFNFLNNVFQTVIMYVGRVLSFAPRSVQVMLFVILGLGVLGLVGTFFIAPNYVCASPPAGTGAAHRLYKADGFFSAFSAKMLSSDSSEQFASDEVTKEAENNFFFRKVMNYLGFGLEGTEAWKGMGTTGQGQLNTQRSIQYGTIVGRWPDVVQNTLANSSASGQGASSFSEGTTVIFMPDDMEQSIPWTTGKVVWYCPSGTNRSSGSWTKGCWTKLDLLSRWLVSSSNTLKVTTLSGGPSSVSSDPSAANPASANEVAVRFEIDKVGGGLFGGLVSPFTSDDSKFYNYCRLDMTDISLDGNAFPPFPSRGTTAYTNKKLYSYYEDFAFVVDTNTRQVMTAPVVRDLTDTSTNSVISGAAVGTGLGILLCGAGSVVSGGFLAPFCAAAIGAGFVGGGAVGVATGGPMSDQCVGGSRATASGVKCLENEWLIYLENGDYGCVRGKYYQMKEIGIEPDTLVNTNVDTTGAVSSRYLFMLKGGIGPGKMFEEVPGDSKNLLQYTCSSSDSVETRVFGVNPFATSTIIFIAILMLFVWIARLLNLI